VKQSLHNAARTVDNALTLVAHVLGHVDKLVGDVSRDSVAVAHESEAMYRTVAGAAIDVREAIRTAPRFLRIVSEAVKMIAAYKVQRARAGVVGEAASAEAMQRVHQRSAQRLYEMCIELRGGVLKIGQFVSTRVDLLPEPYIEQLSKLQDQVPAVPTEQIIARIEGELERPIEELFASFDDEPLAAASLAQVHGAALPDGTRVAVKVQVPGIEDVIEADLAALRVVAALLRDVIPGTDMDTVAKELTRSVREELDFRTEADHAEGFRHRFADVDEVVVPSVYRELTSRRVLTLELVNGARLIDYLDGCERRGEQGAQDRDDLLATMIESFCAQVLDHGVFHADPHPGNFLVLPGPRLGVLDFGSVQQWQPETQRAYAELATAILANDSARVGELMQGVGFATSDGAADGLAKFAEAFLETFRESAGSFDMQNVDPRAELERAMRLTQQYPIARVPRDFVMLGRVFASLSGIVIRYKPRINLFAIIAPHLARAMQTRSAA